MATAKEENFELALLNCLRSILHQLSNESVDLQSRLNLCQELADFLLNTPPVFHSQDKSWLHDIFPVLFHFLQNKWSKENRQKLFRLLSALAYGSGRADWFRYNDTEWTLEESKFIGLETRLACVEVLLALDSSSFDQELIGSCLILLEKSMLLLSDECDKNDSKLIQLMQPDEVSSIITSMRDVSGKIIEFFSLYSGSSSEAFTLSLVRFICLFLVEDTHVTPGQGEQLLPVLFSSLRQESKSHPGYDDHAIISALVSLFERSTLDPAVMNEDDALFIIAYADQCDSCKQLEESVCQSVKRIAQKKILTR